MPKVGKATHKKKMTEIQRKKAGKRTKGRVKAKRRGSQAFRGFGGFR